MEDFCKVLAKILMTLGCIGSIILAWTYGIEKAVIGYRAYEYRNWAFTISIFAVGICSVGFISLLIYWMGEVAGRLNDIARDVKSAMPTSTTNEALHKQATVTDTSNRELYSKDIFWTCKKCKNENFLYETICKCGQRRDDNDQCTD